LLDPAIFYYMNSRNESVQIYEQVITP